MATNEWQKGVIMTLPGLKLVYGEDSPEYQNALKACIEQAEKDRAIVDKWREDLQTEKVRVW